MAVELLGMAGVRRAAIIACAGCIGVLCDNCAAETRRSMLPSVFDGVPDAEGAPPPTRRTRRDLQREIDQLEQELKVAKAASATAESCSPNSTAAAASTGATLVASPGADPASTAARTGNTVRPGSLSPARTPVGPVEQAKTWEEAASLLPQDTAGGVDWMQALASGAIAPRGLDAKEPLPATFPLDVDLPSGLGETFRAKFRHAPHTEWLTCSSCHPTPYAVRNRDDAGRVGLWDGPRCGVCHGKVAFPMERCPRCHPATKKEASD